MVEQTESSNFSLHHERQKAKTPCPRTATWARSLINPRCWSLRGVKSERSWPCVAPGGSSERGPERPDRTVTTDWIIHLFSRFTFQTQGPFVSLAQGPVADDMLAFVVTMKFYRKMFECVSCMQKHRGVCGHVGLSCRVFRTDISWTELGVCLYSGDF